MTHAETQQLKAAIDELTEMQRSAPAHTTYSQGRTEPALSYRIQGVVAQLKTLIKADDTDTKA